MPTCLCPWVRYLVSIASLTWAHQGSIGRGKCYNLSTDKVGTWPVAPLREAKWLWRFSWYRNNRQHLYCIVLYYIVLYCMYCMYCIVLYCIVLYCILWQKALYKCWLLLLLLSSHTSTLSQHFQYIIGLFAPGAGARHSTGRCVSRLGGIQDGWYPVLSHLELGVFWCWLD